MKITDCYPIFYTDNIEEGTKRYEEEYGYTPKHKPDLEMLDYVVMENEKNRRIDLVYSHFPADHFSEGYLGMRVNVDDFNEAAAHYTERGYSMIGTAHENESSITALFTKDDGTYLVVFQHKK